MESGAPPLRAGNPLIVALDVPSLDDAVALAGRVGDAAGAFKVGLELWAAHGPAAVGAVHDATPPLLDGIFLDLKLHDIPTTVARAVGALARASVQPALLTVHALGGRAMLEAAVEAKSAHTRIIAVTILTHLDDAALKEVGLPPADHAVPMLARLALDAGCDGVVCAPADLGAVRAECPRPFLVVTPGVRPAGTAADEQARAATPREAMERGADRLVVGRPVTRAPDPRAAAIAILEELP